jgi:hypothetical protein
MGRQNRDGILGRKAVRAAILAALCAAAAGCDAVSNAWRSDEDRINQAFPMDAAVDRARTRLLEALAKDASGQAALDAELSRRAKLRALSCSNGYSPSLFSSPEAIRAKVGSEKCFAKLDAELSAWLGSQRLHRLLTGPGLRPLPEEPPALLAATRNIGQARFAEAAGVALITGQRLVELIDLGSGESLFSDEPDAFYSSYSEISPNGAVFAMDARSGGQASLLIRESATGETLAEFPDYQRLVWLDSMTAAVTKRNGQGLRLHDFVTGEAVDVKGISGQPARVAAVPGEPSTFVAASHTSLLKFRVTRKSDGLDISLLEQAPGPGFSPAGDAVAGTQMYLHFNHDLWTADLATLRSTKTSFAPARIVSVTALPDPAEVLLSLSIGNSFAGQPRLVVYSTKDSSFYLVEDDRVTGTNSEGNRYASVRTAFVPSLQRLAVISGPTLKFIPDVKRRLRYSAEALIAELQQEDRQRLDKAAGETAQRLGYQSTGSMNGVPIMKGPVADLAKDANVEAVGVYESASGSHGRAKPRVAGPVQVILRRSSKPLVLSLSSNEPVNWKIVNQGAELKAVLLSGNHPSTVDGAGSARVVQIGSMYAYERNGQGFKALQDEVIRWSGKSIDVFQGKYSGGTFLVGGP